MHFIADFHILPIPQLFTENVPTVEINYLCISIYIYIDTDIYGCICLYMLMYTYVYAWDRVDCEPNGITTI